MQEVPCHCLCFPPPPANLPTTRTERSTAHQIIRVDYAGPLRYQKSKGKEGKAYILLYACSLTRGVLLDLMPNMEMTELQWKELKSVLLSVETTLNDRPLGYVEEDIQTTVITPNSLLFLQPNQLLEPSHHVIENKNLRKRYKYLQKCKNAVWSCWTKEYLRSLRERYVTKEKGGRGVPPVGEVVIVRSEQKNRGAWTLGVLIELITGKDGVICGAKVCTGKSTIEQPVQFLYPMELSCNNRDLKGAVSYFTHMLLRITNLKALGQRFQVYRIQNGVLSGGRAWWETQ